MFKVISHTVIKDCNFTNSLLGIETKAGGKKRFMLDIAISLTPY